MSNQVAPLRRPADWPSVVTRSPVSITCLKRRRSLAISASGSFPSNFATAAPAAGAKTFDSPQQAADALINAAEQWDETTLIQIFGPGGDDIVLTGELAQDRQRAADHEAGENPAANGDQALQAELAFVIISEASGVSSI